MPKQIAQNIMVFMQRAQLTGAEVQVFMQCMAELEKLASPVVTAMPGAE